MEQTYRGFEQISTDILQALEQGLQVPAGSLTAKCAKGSSEFRFIHYPPLLVKEAQEGMISRAWPHYDIGVISLLFQDSVGGLEIDDGSGGFAPVVSDKPTDLIVNAAETIQRWSNDRLKAGLHRVTIPRTVDADQGDYTLPRRYSIVYFCKANREASVAPLPELIDERHEAKYDDLTFLAYHQQRLQAAYS
jgi:isopenicillin N synthase-like dioxygenase